MSGPPACPELGDGVYVYEPRSGRWRRGGGWRRGKAVLVFINVVCTRGCAWSLEMIWPRLGRYVEAGLLDLVLVVCTRFRHVCLDREAKKLFAEYGVIASPSVVIECCGRAEALKGRLRIEEGLEQAVARLLEAVPAGY